MMVPSLLKRPNALHPDELRPEERRAELCRLLALGLVRLRMRTLADDRSSGGEPSLRHPPDRSADETPTHKEAA